MNKKQFYEKMEGKIFKKVLNISKKDFILDCKKQVADYNNSQTNELITYEIDDKTIKFSNGQFLMLPVEIQGVLTVRGNFITVDNTRIDKKDIIEVNEKGFKTKYSNYIAIK